MELSVSAPYLPRLDDTFQNDGIQPKRVVQGPDGQIIVEVLDSPLIRKQKSRQKKEERMRLLEQQRLEKEARLPAQKQAPAQQTDLQSVSTGTAGTGASNAAGPSRLARGAEGVEAESELSSLSDVGSETVEVKERTSVSAPLPQGKRKISLDRRVSVSGFGVPEELGAIQANQVLEGGTLVWAKAKTYPWWPAVVYESDDIRIPPSVKAEAELLRSKGQSIFMVQFFDKGRSWGFLSHDKLKMLGEHKELDNELLSVKATKQKWKSAASRADCRAAYDEAMAEMETHSDILRAENPNSENILPENLQPGLKTPVLEVTDAEHVLKEDFSITTATGAVDPETQRAITPESEEMQVDGDN
jgi:NuA3 HAT complex component NTO1